MDQQVAIELMGFLGKNDMEFSDLSFKPDPHSHPVQISRISNSQAGLKVWVNDKVFDFQQLSMPIRQTIGQRLRLIYVAHN